MAYSDSVTCAQVVKLCELCDLENINWRCIDCDQCICNKCKNIHLKTRATTKHEVISIAKPFQDIKKKVLTDNIPCRDHGTRMTCLCCKTCDCLVCPDCVATAHDKHQFVSVESIIDRKLGYLRGIQTDINEKLKSCESKTSEFEFFNVKFNSTHDNSLQQITQREDEFTDIIHKYSQLLKDRAESQRTKGMIKVSKIQQQVEKTRHNLEYQREKVNKILTSNQGQVILDTNMKVPDLQFQHLPSGELFIPGGAAISRLQELFGSFQKISDVRSEIQFEIKISCATNLPLINHVIILNETSAWISCLTEQVLMKVRISNNKLATSHQMSLDIHDMALGPNNQLLLCERQSSDIKLLTKSGEIKPFLTVAPLALRGIYVTKDSDILVGVCEIGAKFTQTDKSQRAVSVFGMDGKQKQLYQYDENRQSLFTFPFGIRTNDNQDILVIDLILTTTGRVVCINKGGSLKWIYKGHCEINKNLHFDPRAMVITSVGNIIISDCNSHAFHVLSDDGEVLRCITPHDTGVRYPWALDIDKNGLLWVGCDTGGRESGAKMHIVKLNA